VTRAISRAWPMTLALPDLGASFTVQPITAGNAGPSRAAAGKFSVTPGVYVLSSAGPVDVTGISREYHAPPPDSLPPSVQSLAPPELLAGRDVELGARVVDAVPPDSATLYIKPTAGGFYRGFPMQHVAGYEYSTSIPSTNLHNGPYEFVIALFHRDSSLTFPDAVRAKPTEWDYYGRATWTVDVVGAQTPLRLFTPRDDAPRLTFTRIGDAGRRGLFRVVMSPVTGEPVFHLELPVDASGWSPADYTASLLIEERIRARQETIAAAEGVRLRLRGLGARQVLHVSLMEDDGTTWSAALPVDSTWTEQTLPLTAFKAGRGVLLPQGFPSDWSYWVGPAAGRGGSADRPRLDHVERLQMSLRREDGVTVTPGAYGVEIEWIVLGF